MGRPQSQGQMCWATNSGCAFALFKLAFWQVAPAVESPNVPQPYFLSRSKYRLRNLATLGAMM